MKTNYVTRDNFGMCARRQARGGAMSMRVDAFGVRDRLKSPSSAVHVAAFVVTALLLSACNKAPVEPPALMMKPAQNATVPTTAGASDTSVPAAGSVLTPAIAAKADPAAERSNSAMSRAQDSSAMPMPGQNNDHSSPLTPAKRASGPVAQPGFKVQAQGLSYLTHRDPVGGHGGPKIRPACPRSRSLARPPDRARSG
jgi:hypothetical protein